MKIIIDFLCNNDHMPSLRKEAREEDEIGGTHSRNQPRVKRLSVGRKRAIEEGLLHIHDPRDEPLTFESIIQESGLVSDMHQSYPIDLQPLSREMWESAINACNIWVRMENLLRSNDAVDERKKVAAYMVPLAEISQSAARLFSSLSLKSYSSRQDLKNLNHRMWDIISNFASLKDAKRSFGKYAQPSLSYIANKNISIHGREQKSMIDVFAPAIYVGTTGSMDQAYPLFSDQVFMLAGFHILESELMFRSISRSSAVKAEEFYKNVQEYFAVEFLKGKSSTR